MLNCLTYIAFVYWALATVHTVLPIDVGLCGADPSRGGLGALLHHTFGGGRVELDERSWEGYPCSSSLVHKIAFILQRPGPTARHIITGGGQNELYVPILMLVPLAFLFVVLVRQLLGVRLMSDTAARTMLKLGIAVGCRGMILLQSLTDPTKQSLYFKRYSKVEFFIVGWTAYIIELPVWQEALVSGGTLATILLMCCLFPHHFLPEVNPWNVAIQAILATICGVGHASYQQRRRFQQRAAMAARAARPPGKGKGKGMEMEAEVEVPPEVRTEMETAAAAESVATGAGTSTAVVGGATVIATTTTTTTTTTITTTAADATTSTSTTSAAPSEAVQATELQDIAPAAEDSATLPAVAAAAAAAAVPDRTDEADEASLAEPSPCAIEESSAHPTSVASAISSSLEALRRMNACGRTRPYVSPARPCRFAIKVQHAHLADLPPNLMSVLNREVLAGSGWQAVSAYAREGCVELVLDLRPILPARAPYRGSGAVADGDRASDSEDDRRSPSDQDDRDGGGTDGASADDHGSGVVLDEDSMRELSRSVVSYLQSTGVLQPEREPSVMLQLGDRTAMMTWQAANQTWEFAVVPAGGAGAGAGARTEDVVSGRESTNSAAVGGGGAAEPTALTADLRAAALAAAAAAVVPSLESLSPRLALWPGLGAPLRLTVGVRGPSAEEILVGGGLVVRHGGRLLPYSVLRITGQPAQPPPKAPPGSASPSSTASPVAVAAARPLLFVDLAVSGVPSSGLIRIEARTSSGLLSAPTAIVVDFDPDLVSGLAVLLADMPDASMDAVLTDYGTWMDAAAAAVAAYCNGGEAAVRDTDVRPNGKDVAAAPSAAPSPSSATAEAKGSPLSMAALLASLAGPLACEPPTKTKAPHVPRGKRRDQACTASGYTGSVAAGTASEALAIPASVFMPAGLLAAPLQDGMNVVAADLLALCCQGGGANPAVAVVADRLIAMVAACDGRPPAIAFEALLAAVPTPPTNAGALHLAVAAGSRRVATVLLRWEERLRAASTSSGGADNGGRHGLGRGGAAISELWLSRATCGVTPLHVAGAMTDGGALAGWALDRYPAAMAAWRTATSDDGLTPAALAAQLGGRWRLRLWHANPTVQAIRRAIALPAPLQAGVELLWGFDDAVQERHYVAGRVSDQTVLALALYAIANVFAPAFTLAKAALSGSSLRGGGCDTGLLASALAIHVPHTVPLLAWLCVWTPAKRPFTSATAAAAAAAPAASYHHGRGSALRSLAATARAALGSFTAALRNALGMGMAPAAAKQRSSPVTPGAAAAAPTPVGGLLSRHRRRGPGVGGLGRSGDGLRRALILMHLSRAVIKAAMGLSVWPFGGGLPGGATTLLACGGDIALEALVRPLLEQLGLPSRLLLSLVDGPATYLLYRSVERAHPGALWRHPLERAALYQAVLLGTTAAVTATSRLRFLRAEQARVAWLEAAAAARSNGSGNGNPRPAQPASIRARSPSSSALAAATTCWSQAPPPATAAAPLHARLSGANSSNQGSRPVVCKSDDQHRASVSTDDGEFDVDAVDAALYGPGAATPSMMSASATCSGSAGWSSGAAATAGAAAAGGGSSGCGGSGGGAGGCSGDVWPHKRKAGMTSSAGVY